jgi:hypothetical protein
MALSSGERTTLAWLASAVGAIVLGAWWLRTWGEPYLIGTTGAIALTLALSLIGTWRVPRLATVAALVWFAVEGWTAMGAFARLDRDWAAYERGRAQGAEQRFNETVREDFAVLQAAAARALELPAGVDARFRALESALPSAALGEVAAIVFDGERATTWMGPVRIDVESLVQPVGVVWTEFYVVAFATSSRDGRRADIA